MRGRGWAAVMALLCLLLAGCGGNPEPKPAPKAEPSSSPSASATPPVLPAAAKPKTKAGADAFVRHYVSVLNYAGASGDTGPLRDLSLDTCVKCAALTNGIDRVYGAGGELNGGGWTVVGTKAYGWRQGHFFLDARINSAPQQLVPKKGAAPQQFAGAKNRLRSFVLERDSTGWKVSELDPSA